MECAKRTKATTKIPFCIAYFDCQPLQPALYDMYNTIGLMKPDVRMLCLKRACCTVFTSIGRPSRHAFHTALIPIIPWRSSEAASFRSYIPNSRVSSMKRAASSVSKAAPRAKKPRPVIPEYHSTPSLRDESGEIIWPAPKAQIEGARKFILEWSVDSNNANAMINDTQRFAVTYEHSSVKLIVS